MSKLLSFLFLILVSSTGFANDNTTILAQSENLISQRKYNTAYKLLDSLDRRNQQVDLVLAKVDLALNYYANSIMHQFFGFADLEEGQSLDSVRGKAGTYSLYMLKAQEILDSLLVKHPDDARLHKALGDYYYEAFLRYGNEWVMSEEELMLKLDHHFMQAVLGKQADYDTYFALGYLRMGEEKWKDAIGFLDQTIRLNPIYPPAYYNMAYCLMQEKKTKAAITYGNGAWQLYENSEMKADVARLLSLLYDENNQVDSAIYYLKKGLEIVPRDYYLLKDYLEVALREKLYAKDSIQLEFFLIAPDNPTIYNVLAELHRAYEETDMPLLNFYSDMKKVFAGQDKVMGNLSFFTGQLLYNEEKEKAKIAFKEAEVYFKKSLEPKNPVFSVIEQYLNQE